MKKKEEKEMFAASFAEWLDEGEWFQKPNLPQFDGTWTNQIGKWITNNNRNPISTQELINKFKSTLK